MNLQENILRIREMISLVCEQNTKWHPPMVNPENKNNLYYPIFNEKSYECKSCDQRTKENIVSLEPELQERAKMFIDRVFDELKTKLTIVQGYRSPEEQDKLYCKGRPKDEYCKMKKIPTDGNIVTTKKGGESTHNFGKAFDVYFNEGGKVNVNKSITPEVGKIGQELGLIWGGGGGKFTNFVDPPHFELPY